MYIDSKSNINIKKNNDKQQLLETLTHINLSLSYSYSNNQSTSIIAETDRLSYRVSGSIYHHTYTFSKINQSNKYRLDYILKKKNKIEQEYRIIYSKGEWLEIVDYIDSIDDPEQIPFIDIVVILISLFIKDSNELKEYLESVEYKEYIKNTEMTHYLSEILSTTLFDCRNTLAVVENNDKNICQIEINTFKYTSTLELKSITNKVNSFTEDQLKDTSDSKDTCLIKYLLKEWRLLDLSPKEYLEYVLFKYRYLAR